MSKVIKPNNCVLTLTQLRDVNSNHDLHGDAKQKFKDIIIVEAQHKASSILNNARLESAELLIKVNKEKEEIIENAQKEISSIKETAYLEGFNQGIEEGRRKSELLIQEVFQLLEKSQVKYENIAKKSEEDIVNLVMMISEKIINQQITINQESMFSIIKEGLKTLSVKKDIVIFLSPDDYDFISKNKDELLADISETVDLHIVSNPTKNKGYCYIESPSGQLDVSVETQIENMRNHLLKVVELNNE